MPAPSAEPDRFPVDAADPVAVAARDLRLALDVDAVARDRAGGRPIEAIRLLKASGLPLAAIPSAYGGAGAPWLSVLRAVREIARTDGSVAHLFGYHHLPLHVVQSVGTAAQRSEWLMASAREAWLWANSGNVMSPTAHGRREGRGWVVDGFRPFSSGSHVADRIMISWEAGLERLTAIVPADRDGLVVEDDWNGIGQTQTGSGRLSFQSVHVWPEEILHFGEGQTPFQSLTSLLQQAVLANVFVGSAQGALSEGRAYTVGDSRPWVYSRHARHSDDAFVQERYGALYARTLAAAELADKAARSLDAAYAKGAALTAAERGRVAIELAAANAYGGEVGLAATSGVFEAMGARSATRANGFDRFWRNVRIHTLHNPAEYKKRTVGTWVLTGDFPAGAPYR